MKLVDNYMKKNQKISKYVEIKQNATEQPKGPKKTSKEKLKNKNP